MSRRIPVIDCTDLYHPHQDVGDNFDIVAAYALPEIDLRAVILDVTNRFREPSCRAAGFDVGGGPREPGIIPLTQMNYIFGRTVAFAPSPFMQMRSPDDRMLDLPRFEQAGVELLLLTLRDSSEPVEILIFCSARTVAVAFNREPELLRRKVKRIHLSAGTTSGELFDVDWSRGERKPLAAGSPGYREWNVELDVHAFAGLLRSGLPLALYPCASDRGPFSLHRHNSFYALNSMRFVRRMQPKLRSYLAYAFNRGLRHDFLRAMDQDPAAEVLDAIDAIARHNVWETAVWLEVSGRKLIHRPGIGYRIVEAAAVTAADRVLQNDQTPCRIEVRDDGRFDFELTDQETGVTIYDRGTNVEENERAFQDALPELYQSFEIR
jgi:pyrimidine-specific ribonucleoside hydrolase